MALSLQQANQLFNDYVGNQDPRDPRYAPLTFIPSGITYTYPGNLTFHGPNGEERTVNTGNNYQASVDAQRLGAAFGVPSSELQQGAAYQVTGPGTTTQTTVAPVAGASSGGGVQSAAAVGGIDWNNPNAPAGWGIDASGHPVPPSQNPNHAAPDSGAVVSGGAPGIDWNNPNAPAGWGIDASGHPVPPGGGDQGTPNAGAPSSDAAAAGLTGDFAGMFDAIAAQIAAITAAGQSINPNIEITPEKVAEFTKQAELEINPYYKEKLAIAREGFLRQLGYSKEELARTEQNLERKYGRSLRTLGGNEAEKGFALSGERQQQERDLQMETQQDIEDRRRKLQFEAGTAAGEFAGKFGTAETPAFSIGGAPDVFSAEGALQQSGGRTFDLPGSSFGQSGSETPFYTLSPSVYGGVVGSEEYARRGAVGARAGQLEEAYRRGEAVNQTRNLVL